MRIAGYFLGMMLVGAIGSFFSYFSWPLFFFVGVFFPFTLRSEPTEKAVLILSIVAIGLGIGNAPIWIALQKNDIIQSAKDVVYIGPTIFLVGALISLAVMKARENKERGWK
ncbi:MAG: hypothetical protein WAV31_04705 [Candidatus Moraniibacteriota bacterium]